MIGSVQADRSARQQPTFIPKKAFPRCLQLADTVLRHGNLCEDRMCAAKYANLTSDMLIRNAASLLALSEESHNAREHAAARSTLNEITTAPALIAVENLELGAKLLRHAMEFSAATIVFRIAVVPHTPHRVTLTLLGSSETFDYDEQQQKWLGGNGSTLDGGAELFENPTDWSVLIRTDQCRTHTIELCRGSERHKLNLQVKPRD